MEELITRYNNKNIADREIDELIGLCRGILADGCIVEAEAEYLLDWLKRQKSGLDSYPFNLLYERLVSMLSDGVLDAEEQMELIDLFSKIIGNPVVPEMQLSSSAMPYTCHEFNTLENLKICLTGEFEFGKRSDIVERLAEQGAVFSKGVTQKIDALYIGSIGNSAWEHSSFGRKIEKVLELNTEKGLDIAVLGEEHLVPLL